MARHFKRGMDAGAIKAADAKVRETVEDILAQVDAAQGRRDPRRCRRSSTTGSRKISA